MREEKIAFDTNWHQLRQIRRQLLRRGHAMRRASPWSAIIHQRRFLSKQGGLAARTSTNRVCVISSDPAHSRQRRADRTKQNADQPKHQPGMRMQCDGLTNLLDTDGNARSQATDF